jgi:hypothetical protein
MIQPAEYTVESVKAALVEEGGHKGYRADLVSDAADFTLEWWRERGCRCFHHPNSLMRDRHAQLFHDGCKYVLPRMQTRVTGLYKFVFIPFLLMIIIKAIVSWVVQQILEWLLHNRRAAAVFGDGQE